MTVRDTASALLFACLLLISCKRTESKRLPDFLSLNQSLGFTTLPVSKEEESILTSPTHSAVLLRNGERHAAVFYSEAPPAYAGGIFSDTARSAHAEPTEASVHLRQGFGGHPHSSAASRRRLPAAAGEMPNAAEQFRRLKEHIYEISSAHFSDVTDETMRRPGFRTVEYFAFTDPSLLDERYLFARIENALYEFHVPAGEEGWVQGLLLELARQ
ncbi:MAG: hypothetical protein AAB853_04705 [Patescibacteria group bacterium]